MGRVNETGSVSLQAHETPGLNHALRRSEDGDWGERESGGRGIERERGEESRENEETERGGKKGGERKSRDGEGEEEGS
jgi:hypothetical protein